MNRLSNINWFQMIFGILFTFVIAALGYLLAIVPGFNKVGPLASAIILAIIYRQFFGYPEKVRAGVQFSSKYILRLAIILYGLKLNVDTIFDDGLGLLVKAIVVIAFTILITVYLGKLFKAEGNLTLLLGIGTGVCGAAAIAATAPILKSKAEDTAIGIAIIALVGTLFAIAYTIILPFLPLSDMDYAVWSGLSLHELAHVALAAEPAGENELAMALLAKLTRVFLLVPLCFVLILWLKSRKSSKDEGTKNKVPFPYFLIGFIAMSLFGSYGMGTIVDISAQTMEWIGEATTFLLAAAMVGLGASVSLATIRTKAMRPLAAMMVASVVLSGLVYLMQVVF